MKVVVTGASGKAGRAVVRGLLERDHEVLGVDLVPPQDERFPSFWEDARRRRWNLWGYVDARDVAQSCVLALERDLDGAEHFIVAAADTVMNRPSRELMAEVYAEVPYRPTAGDFDSLLSSEKARAMLGYSPGHSWRDHLETS